jgi:purine-cytosine permease-like protein
MVVQAGKAIVAVFPGVPFWAAALTLSVLQITWALVFGSPGGKINEIAVVLLAGLCVVFFVESIGYKSDFKSISDSMSIMLGIELSIAMPISWLPLVGDYSCKAKSKTGAVLMPFLGYFLGSCVMYFIGLLIVVSSGKNIFEFIASIESSRLRYAACGIVVLSTITTSFIDIYSAAVSSTQWIKVKNIRIPIIVIGLFALVVSVFFPVDRFEAFLENFLLTIAMVFVSVFVLVFLEFFMKKPNTNKSVNYRNLIIVFIGIAGNWLFNRYSVFIPTLMTALLVFTAYIVKNQFEKREERM